MLDIFRKTPGASPRGPDGAGDGEQRSHIFPKFMKRLGRSTRPSVLDLGRLSGANIEIFARLGARVQVEDLMAALPVGGSEPIASPRPAIDGPGDGDLSAPIATARAEESSAPAALEAAGGVAVSDPGAAPTGAAVAPLHPGAIVGRPLPPGARPSRRIVLPPRHQARPAAGADPGSPTRQATAPPPSPLPDRFEHADASFDAILGWDLFNYYDLATARRVAAEISRILKPGGLVFAWFHSRSASAPDGPRRFRVLDETRFQVDPFDGRALPRHLYQNRDIEKMFTDLRIAELYFLKNGVREMMLEKRPPGAPAPAGTPPARPRPRFRLE